MAADRETPPEMAAGPSRCSSTETVETFGRLPAPAKAAILVAWHPRCRLQFNKNKEFAPDQALTGGFIT